MRKKKPSRDPIATFERESKAARRVGQGSQCYICEEARPLALISATICAACQRWLRGYSLHDEHHPAGHANDPIRIPIPVNDHRAILSPKQYEWPQETWENPEGSPVLAEAASIRGYYETTEYFADGLLLPDVEFLEALDPFLKERLGPRWWVGTPLERFAPKRKSKT